MRELQLISYNSSNTSSAEQKPFFDQIDPQLIQVVAIQEPGWKAETKSTLVPRGYRAAHSQEESARVCFLVSQGVDVKSWRMQQRTSFLATLTLESGEPIHIINVYAH